MFERLYVQGFVRRWIVVFDLRSKADYFERHIYGAFNIDLSHGLATVHSLDDFQELMMTLCDHNAQVILSRKETNRYICCLYGDPSSSKPVQFAQTLSFYQLFNPVFILEGGIDSIEQQSPYVCYNRKKELKMLLRNRQTITQEITPSGETYPLPSAILPYLFIGSWEHVRNPDVLDSLAITHLVNCACEIDVPQTTEVSETSDSALTIRHDYPTDRSWSYLEGEWQGRHVLHFNLEDTTEADFCQFLPRACMYIESAKQDGGKVLVFCHQGRSRSASIVIGYLMMMEALGRLRYDGLDGYGIEVQMRKDDESSFPSDDEDSSPSQEQSQEEPSVDVPIVVPSPAPSPIDPGVVPIMPVQVDEPEDEDGRTETVVLWRNSHQPSSQDKQWIWSTSPSSPDHASGSRTGLLKQAFFHVKFNRRVIAPNEGFLRGLIGLELCLSQGMTGPDLRRERQMTTSFPTMILPVHLPDGLLEQRADAISCARSKFHPRLPSINMKEFLAENEDNVLRKRIGEWESRPPQSSQPPHIEEVSCEDESPSPTEHSLNAVDDVD